MSSHSRISFRRLLRNNPILPHLDQLLEAVSLLQREFLNLQILPLLVLRIRQHINNKKILSIELERELLLRVLFEQESLQAILAVQRSKSHSNSPKVIRGNKIQQTPHRRIAENYSPMIKNQDDVSKKKLMRTLKVNTMITTMSSRQRTQYRTRNHTIMSYSLPTH